MPTKKSRACVKRERPIWWTQEGVLAKLQDGTFIMAVCQSAADEMAQIGMVISPNSLRAEVAKWCESASWGPQLKTALALWKKSSSGEMVMSKVWHGDFLGAMEACEGNAEKAAKMAQVGYGVVLALLDKRNRCYDREFAERFRLAELERIGRVREKYMELAENGEGKAASRAQERLIESALPSLHGQKQELHVSGTVEHDHEHTHGFSGALAREVVLASQDRMRKLNAGRQGMLPPVDRSGSAVIDVTPIIEVGRV